MLTLLGFPVLPTGGPQLGTYLVPGTAVKLTLAKEVAPLLLAVARDFDREVEDLIPGQCGGFNPRKIAGSESWSRHAAGLAIDLNWSKHPMGRRGTFTTAQNATIDRILARYTFQGKQLIRAGKDYSHADDQHFEVDVDRLVALAAVKALQTPPKKPATTGHKPGTRELKLTTPLMRGEDVSYAQRWTGAHDDGAFGKATQARVARYQRIVGLPASGRVDKATWSRMLGRTIKL